MAQHAYLVAHDGHFALYETSCLIHVNSMLMRFDSTWSEAWLNARAWTQGAGAGAKLTHGGAQIPASWILLDPLGSSWHVKFGEVWICKSIEVN